MAAFVIVKPASVDKFYVGDDLVVFPDLDSESSGLVDTLDEAASLLDGGEDPGLPRLPVVLVDTEEIVGWAINHGFLDTERGDCMLERTGRGLETGVRAGTQET
jgi:hypothetical protein